MIPERRADRDLARFSEIPDPFVLEAATALLPVRPRPVRRSPTRSAARAMRLVALAAAVLGQVAWLVLVGVRRRPAPIELAGLALQLAVALGGAAMALSMVPRRLGGPTARVGVMMGSVVGAAATFVVYTGTTGATDPILTVTGFMSPAMKCLLETTALSLGPLAVFAWALRRAFESASALRTAAIGVACSALAVVTMTLACERRGTLHVLVGHGSVFALATLAGAMVGARVTQS